VLHQHLPQQRALPEELKAKVSSSMRIRASKKLLQEQISSESRKVVLLKLLHNNFHL